MPWRAEMMREMVVGGKARFGAGTLGFSEAASSV